MQNWENLKARFQNFNHTFNAHVVQHQEANTKKKNGPSDWIMRC